MCTYLVSKRDYQIYQNKTDWRVKKQRKGRAGKSESERESEERENKNSEDRKKSRHE